MRLIVTKLFGERDFDIHFNDKLNILIGHNGSGKSTILKIINCLINNDLVELAQIEFEEITFEIEENEIELYEQKEGEISRIKNLVCKIKREDIVPLHYAKDAKFRIILKSFLEKYNFLKDIENKKLDFDRFFNEFHDEFEKEKSGIEINVKLEKFDYITDIKMFFNHNTEIDYFNIYDKNDVSYDDVRVAAYNGLTFNYCYGCKIYLYNIYLAYIRFEIIKKLNLPVRIPVKIIADGQLNQYESIFFLNGNLCDAMIDQMFRFNKFETIKDYYDCIFLKRKTNYKLLITKNDYNVEYKNRKEIMLMYEIFNRNLRLLPSIFNLKKYDDYVKFKDQQKYKDKLLTRESFVRLIKALSVAPNKNYLSDGRISISFDNEYSNEEIDKLKKVFKIININKKDYKLEKEEYTIENYDEIIDILKEKKSEVILRVAEEYKKSNYSREQYILDRANNPFKIVMEYNNGRIKTDRECIMQANIFLSEEIMKKVTNLNIKDYHESPQAKAFYAMADKYFYNKEFELDYDDQDNITVKIYDKRTKKEIREEFLSSGEYKILRIIKRLAFSKDYDFYFLDEPELSLSVYWQSMLLDDILKYGNQFNTLIATQSPYLISQKQIKYLVEVKENEE